MKRRQFLATVSVASTSPLASCSNQYEQLLRERKYPNINEQTLDEAVNYLSDIPNPDITIEDFRTESVATVHIQENIIKPTYNPPLIFITPQTTVQWINKLESENDQEYGKYHTITGVSDTAIDSDALAVNERFEYTFTETQLFTYKCKLYDTLNMKGAVLVSDSEPARD